MITRMMPHLYDLVNRKILEIWKFWDLANSFRNLLEGNDLSGLYI